MHAVGRRWRWPRDGCAAVQDVRADGDQGNWIARSGEILAILV
jgi:hypothetical protein